MVHDPSKGGLIILEVLSNFNDSMTLLGEVTEGQEQFPFFQPGHWPQTGLTACLGSCKEKQILAGDRVWHQFVVFSRSHRNQQRKLQLTSADADLGLQHGTESGLLCQDLPCSASARAWLRTSENC